MGNFRPQDHDDWMEAMQSLQDAGDDDGLRMWLDAYPYPVKVCEQTLLGVHQRVSSVIEAEIDAEQYRTGGSFAVTWEVGTMGFEHRVGRDGRAHRQARPIIESRRPRTS